MSAPALASRLLNHAADLCAVKEAGRRSQELTVTAVKELGDDGGAAGRPRTGAVDLNQRGRHHVVVLQFPKHVGARLHVIVRHVEHVACCVGGGKCRKADTNQVKKMLGGEGGRDGGSSPSS